MIEETEKWRTARTNLGWKEHPVSTDGTCPRCGHMAYAYLLPVANRAVCCQCESVYIRLTGNAAFCYRRDNKIVL